MEPILLTNQKTLIGKKEEERLNEADSWRNSIYRLLGLDCKRLGNISPFELTNESRQLILRGTNFGELKDLVKVHWPNMAQGLVERENDTIGRVIAHRSYNKDVEVYTNSDNQMVIYLSGVAKSIHTNNFAFYGTMPEIEKVRNLVDSYSRTHGYNPLSAKVLQFKRGLPE